MTKHVILHSCQLLVYLRNLNRHTSILCLIRALKIQEQGMAKVSQPDDSTDKWKLRGHATEHEMTGVHMHSAADMCCRC